jgi:hypothetical protein
MILTWIQFLSFTIVSGQKLPSELLDLSRWRLTLPIGEMYNPLEVNPPFLIDYYHPEYFYVSADDAVVFKAPCGGVTKSSTGYPRSELRELDPLKNSDITWSAASGIHEMTSVMRITNLPVVKPELCIAQVKNDNNDVVSIVASGIELLIKAVWLSLEVFVIALFWSQIMCSERFSL